MLVIDSFKKLVDLHANVSFILVVMLMSLCCESGLCAIGESELAWSGFMLMGDIDVLNVMQCICVCVGVGV